PSGDSLLTVATAAPYLDGSYRNTPNCSALPYPTLLYFALFRPPSLGPFTEHPAACSPPMIMATTLSAGAAVEDVAMGAADPLLTRRFGCTHRRTLAQGPEPECGAAVVAGRGGATS